MCALFAAAAVFFYMRYERVAKSAAAVREALARTNQRSAFAKKCAQKLNLPPRNKK